MLETISKGWILKATFVKTKKAYLLLPYPNRTNSVLEKVNPKTSQPPLTAMSHPLKPQVKPPIHPHALQTVTVTDLSRGGAGVARDAQGRTLFIPFAAPGDRLQVASSSRHPPHPAAYAHAQIVEILEPSTLRLTPRCPVFTQCGGCQWQHLPYATQWQTKKRGLFEALHRAQVPLADLPEEAETLLAPLLAKRSAHAPPPQPAPHPPQPPSQSRADWEELAASQVWNYRNRIQLRGRYPEVGFLRFQSHERVAISHCDLARPELNAALPAVIQESARFGGRDFKVELEVQPPDLRVTRAWNQPHAAQGFRQIHDQQNLRLQQWLLTEVQIGELKGTLFDLFGGSGNLSHVFSDGPFHDIRVVDTDQPHHRLHHQDLGFPSNTRPQPFAQRHFHTRGVVDWLQQVRLPDVRLPLTVFLDPPRAGLADSFFALATHLDRLKASTIFLIGCQVDAFAKDVARFLQWGALAQGGQGRWRLKKLMILDFFPQTPHLESVAIFMRN